MGKKHVTSASAGINSFGPTSAGPFEILLSLAGRVPVLADARLQLYGTGCSAFLGDVLER